MTRTLEIVSDRVYFRVVAGVLFVSLLVAACGEKAPAGPPPTQPTTPPALGTDCRVYPSMYTSTFSYASPEVWTCSFDRSTAQLTCGDQTTSYGSAGDFVDEASVLGRVLATRKDVENRGYGERYFYDTERRLTQWETFAYYRFSGSTTNYIFTAWDTYGRPTAGTVIRASGFSPPPAPGPDFPGATVCSFGVSYDDASRTITWSTCPDFPSRTETYNEAFFLSTVVTQWQSGIVDTTTNTVNTTFKVCK